MSFQFVLYNDPGIIIPCIHSPPSKNLKIRLIFENYERLIYATRNGEQLVSLRYLHSKKYMYANPFCAGCELDIIRFMSSTYLYEGKKYPKMVNLKSEVERLNNEARDQIQELIRTKQDNDVEIIYDYNTTFINLIGDRFCDADEFSAWISAGNYAYRKNILAFEGILRVITEKEEALPPWLKFSKPWVYGLTSSDYQEFVYWNKLPGINDIDKTCAICYEGLLNREDQKTYLDPNIDDEWLSVSLYGIEQSLESIVKLACECKHMYHEPCILKWLHQNPVCPHCRIYCRIYMGPPELLSNGPSYYYWCIDRPNLRLQDL